MLGFDNFVLIIWGDGNHCAMHQPFIGYLGIKDGFHLFFLFECYFQSTNITFFTVQVSLSFKLDVSPDGLNMVLNVKLPGLSDRLWTSFSTPPDWLKPIYGNVEKVLNDVFCSSLIL